MRVTPGFLLLAGILLYLDQTVGILFPAILASVCHELGHLLASRYFGGRGETLLLSVTGAELKFSYPAMLSYGADSLIALAGPAVNLLVGGASVILKYPLFAMTNLAIALFNLIPILPLDGGRILYNVVCEWISEAAAEHISSVFAGIFIGILLGVGLISAVHYANIVLLILSGWLLAETLRKQNKFFQNN